MRERSEEEKRLQGELDQANNALEIQNKQYKEVLRAVAVLMAAGHITQEKWEKALEIANW
jgi:hypothetical protein